MTEKESNLPSIAENLTSAAVAAGTAGVTLTALPAAGAAVLPVVVSGLLAAAVSARQKRITAKVDKWFQLIADLLNLGSPENAAKVIEENIDEQWAHDGVIEGVRAILSDIDDACIPALAKLVARTLKSKLAPDRRDRNAIQLLAECDAITYEALVRFLELAETQVGKLPIVEAHIGGKAEEARQVHSADDFVQLFGAEVENGKQVVVGESTVGPGVDRAFHLLKKYEFGRDNPAGFFDVASGPQVITIRAETITYLRYFLS